MDIYVLEYNEEYLDSVINIFKYSLGECEETTRSCILFHTEKEKAKFWIAVKDDKALVF